MLNIVVPMAGRGSRFAIAGYTDPKPLIRFGGKPMIQWVVENIAPKAQHRFIFICLAEHLASYANLPETLSTLCPGCKIVAVNQVTQGAACTVLLAKEFIDNNDRLMIANADQFVTLGIDEYLGSMERQSADGLIMTFHADDPKWSYCRMSHNGEVAEVREKQVVSNEATVGIYNFRRGADFVRAAERMIFNDLRVNGEFYVAPVYNQLIEEGRKVVVARTGFEYDGMYGLGVPGDLDFFMTTSIYENNRTDGAPPLQSNERLASLTRQYVQFFNSRNLSGVAALMTEDFILEDPTVKQIRGKNLARNYLKKLFEEFPALEFNAKHIIADDTRSVIEFSLSLGGKILKGADVIEWKQGKMTELRAYLY